MNSKEALRLLETRCRFYAQDNDELQETYEAREKIEKDLEVLEMLKKKMSIGTDYYDSDDGCKKCEFITYNGEALNIDTEEVFNKIKEWLEDENNK